MTTATPRSLYDLPADLEDDATSGPTRIYLRSHEVFGVDLTVGTWIDLYGQRGAGWITNLRFDPQTGRRWVTVDSNPADAVTVVGIDPGALYTVVDPDSVVEIGATDQARPGTFPDLPGFDDIDGARISYIGEDGDMVVLGHPGRLLVLNAINHLLGRDVGGDEAEKRLRRCHPVYGWAEQVTRCDEFPDCDTRNCDRCLADPNQYGHDDCPKNRCGECAEIQAADWCLQYGRYPVNSSGAFPVVIIYA